MLNRVRLCTRLTQVHPSVIITAKGNGLPGVL